VKKFQSRRDTAKDSIERVVAQIPHTIVSPFFELMPKLTHKETKTQKNTHIEMRFEVLAIDDK